MNHPYTHRFNRQQLIKGWDQEALQNAAVMVVGAGALGNEIIKNLALLGIGQILIIDFDEIELSNLSRTVLFNEKDIGKSKAAAAAAAAQKLAPKSNIQFIHGDLFHDVGLGFYKHIDLVISGLDNIAARSKVGRSCYYANKPFIDGGIWAMGGEVRYFLPGEGFCYDCTLSPVDWQSAHIRNSCTGFKAEKDAAPPAPTTISTTSIIGGLLAQEAVRFFCNIGKIESGEALVYNGLQVDLHKTELPGDTSCHCKLGQAFSNIIELPLSTRNTTAVELLEIASQHLEGKLRLELGRDLLIGFSKSTCEERPCLGEQQFPPPFSLINQVEESEKDCSHCQQARVPSTISWLEANSPYAKLNLKQLGIPPGEILAIMNEEQVYFFELTKDIMDFWF